MINHLYRFRPIERLVGDTGELAMQEIYFAPPEDLNDPMEGFKDILWRGDLVVWRSLFKHYLLCSAHAYSLLAVFQEDRSIAWSDIPIFDPYNLPSTPSALANQQALIKRFFSNKLIDTYIRRLSTRTGPIRQNELRVHLRNIHLVTMPLIHRLFLELGLITGPSSNIDLSNRVAAEVERAINSIDLIEEMEKLHPEKEFVAEAIFAAHRNAVSQLDLINQYNRVIDPDKKNKVFVLVEFPDAYVQQLERLIHPEWYTACFMGHCANSSAWGNYGSSHSGACLKFKTNCSNDRITLNLSTLTGWGSNGPSYSIVPHEFRSITYDQKHPSIDFFRNLGRMTIPTINKHWYRDDDGQRSACAEKGFEDTDEWRKVYWNNFLEATTTKHKDWEFETEYRLVLHSNLFDLSKKEDRKLKYDFNDLDGIIFGIKTSASDKFKILKVIDEKCRRSNRNDFKFYQAYYSRKENCIKYAQMPLLKFDGN